MPRIVPSGNRYYCRGYDNFETASWWSREHQYNAITLAQSIPEHAKYNLTRLYNSFRYCPEVENTIIVDAFKQHGFIVKYTTKFLMKKYDLIYERTEDDEWYYDLVDFEEEMKNGNNEEEITDLTIPEPYYSDPNTPRQPCAKCGVKQINKSDTCAHYYNCPFWVTHGKYWPEVVNFISTHPGDLGVIIVPEHK